MRLCTLIVLTFSLWMTAYAQPQPPAVEWVRTYGGNDEDASSSIISLAEGGFAFCGTTFSIGSGINDFWLLKTDADGDCLWCRAYGGYSMDDCWGLKQTADGGYILAGNTVSFGSGSFDCWLVKTNADGDSLWSRTYGGISSDYCIDVLQTSDCGFILLGGTNSFGAGAEDVWLIKADANGDSLWSRTYGGSDNDWGSGIVQTPDGGYAIAGTTYSYGAGWNDFWLIKVDANGDSLWSQTYGNPFLDNCGCIIRTTDGGFILAGGICVSQTSPCGFQLLKTDSMGNQEWVQTYSLLRYEIVQSVRQTMDGGYILGGTYQAPDVTWGAWILRTDGNGDSLWSLAFRDSEQYGLEDIICTDDGGYLLAGFRRHDDLISDDAWLVKLTPEMSVSEATIPRSIYLLTAYPNPFNSTTQIEFTLPVTQRVSLKLYDVLGREVAVLLDEMRTEGEHRVSFDGSGLSSGVYFCRMEAGKEARMQKIVLMR